ncbi:hypothetical protein D6777_04140 [Candidatus Woesearchaeota archaeon]|nr:MAG: hypothetical protein D6777_04140 [Candidatus Woesearchaeota archaeon]
MSLVWKTFKRHYLWKTLFFVVLLLFVGSFFTDNYAFLRTGKSVLNTEKNVAEFNGDKVKLDFYVMSQCPYGVQVENAVAPVLKKMGNAVDFTLNFIGRTNGDEFQSLHGQEEVNEDIRQLCIQKDFNDKLVDYLLCLNKDARNSASRWEQCAKDNGIDVDKVKNCFDNEGKQLLKDSFKASDDIGATGSPTIYVNDKPYQSGRDALSFQRALCQNLKNHPECEDLPECGTDADCTAEEGKIGVCQEGSCAYKDPVVVDFVVLNDEKCKNCDTTQIVDVTKSYFPGAKVKNVDVSSDEGKALVEKYGVKLVPAYFLDKNLDQTYFWQNEPRIRTAFEETEDGYKLKDDVTGASWFVDEDARKEFYETIGVTLGDNKPQIDFFVMSYCPYGNQAETAIEPVYQLLKDKAEFKPHYVIYSNYQGGGPQFCLDKDSKYCSMHGVQEMNQDMREACVKELSGMDAWFKFALEMNTKCNYQNADTCWEGVAKDLGYDAEAIKSCFDEKAEEYAAEDLELGNKLGVRGSPTVFIDGEQYSGPRTPEGYKQALCSAFEDRPEECDTVLEGQTATQTTNNAAGCGA